MLSLLPNKGVCQCQKYLTARIMAKVQITQIRSTINRPEKQKLTIKALGLGKLNRTVEKELTPQIEGMINKVSHLVSVSSV